MFVLIIADPIAYTAIRPVDDHIRLVLPGQSPGLANSGVLTQVFGGDAFVALPPDGPPVFIGHHMLVPGPPPFVLAGAFKKDLCEFD